VLRLLNDFMKMEKTITFKTTEEFSQHLEKQAFKVFKKEKKVGTYIKAILKKYTKFKEKELV